MKALLRCIHRIWVFVFLLIIVFYNLCIVNSQLSCPSNTRIFTFVKADAERFEAFISSVQQAINEAENYSTIYVPSGIFNENVVVNKTVSLIGAANFSSVIDGGNKGTVLEITANDVVIRGFKLQNSGYGWTRHGIYAYRADHCIIENNHLFKDCHNIRLNYSQGSTVKGNIIDGVMTQPTMYGIRVENSINCTVEGNHVSDCVGAVHLQNATNCVVLKNLVNRNSQGIRFYTPCAYNAVFENDFCNNSYDGMISVMPGNTTLTGNRVFHNNFINNSSPFIGAIPGVTWDDGYPSGGNYWSIYNGTDANGDGIGDTQYAVSAYDKDRYPLMHPYDSIRNLNTNLTYLTIQSAINASETLNGHTIFVKSGKYHEHVVVNKALSLVGENQTTAIIDGGNVGTVLTVNADNVSVVGFTIRNSGLSFPPYGDDYGVLLNHCSWSNISHNLVMNNRIGIYLLYSRSNIIEDNIVSSNHVNGIWLYYSSNNVLAENRISNNSYNFGVFGGDFSDFNNTIDVSNAVEGKPIQYLIGVEDKIFDNSVDIGVLYLINCNNVTVRDLNLTRNGHGVFCYNVTDSRIENIVASNNNYGIYVQNSFGNTIIDNYCPNNWVGICLQESRNNTVESNVTPNNEKGISLYKADNNNVTRNTISNNLYGIRLFASSFNEVFHNNLVGNTNHVSLINSYLNVWDNGFEGNFWSNYTGSDVDRDGLGDTPQIIDDNNRDYHPLLGPFYNFSIYHEGKLYDVTLISNSTILKLVFETANHTIRLTVNGTNGTFGFCRICIPHALIEPEIAVIIDDGLTEVLYLNYTLRDDGFRRWIYFAYQHSTHEILIIPEFWSMIFLSTLMVITLWYLFFRKLEMRLRLKHSMDVSDG